jgi:hypothetical protein
VENTRFPPFDDASTLIDYTFDPAEVEAGK